tara:strand:+ start:353 stop:1357 length:1005 start_codon:yes stop_codon:yes gene_type:complete
MKLNKLSIQHTIITVLTVFIFYLVYFFMHSSSFFYLIIILAIAASYFLHNIYLKKLYKIKYHVASLFDNNIKQVESKDEIDEIINSLNFLTEKIEKDKNDLDRLTKIRSEFLANVSHELKTPIFTIKGFVDTLLDGALEDSNVNKIFLMKIKKQSNRLDNLFSDLIDITKIESNELALNMESIRLQNIIDWLETSYESKAKSKDIILVFPDCSNITIKADLKYIKSVFSNLLENAINYSEKGKIIISIKNISESKISISILDNGIGIKNSQLGRIFERFYRVDNDRSRDTGGTGLGLAIVKHILDAHGSKIRVESKVNQGTVFSFELNKILTKS